jgi:hypothetical protein
MLKKGIAHALNLTEPPDTAPNELNPEGEASMFKTSAS